MSDKLIGTDISDQGKTYDRCIRFVEAYRKMREAAVIESSFVRVFGESEKLFEITSKGYTALQLEIHEAFKAVRES